MATPVPSREALRALARFCRNSERASLRHYSSTVRHPSTKPITYSARIRPIACTVRTVTPSFRSKSTTVDAPEHAGFTNDTGRYEDTPKQGTSDPESDPSEALPDITNYYTLFPKTIPHGPPQPPSQVSDSNTTLSSKHSTSPFHIDTRALRKEFLQLQSIYHPDKYPAGSTAHQRAYALSTLLNNAYRTLSDPLLRAQYILQILYDVDVSTEDNSAYPTDPETLEIVMDAQEDLESISDDTEGQKTVERLKSENDGRMRETQEQLAKAFEAGDIDGATSESVRLKYWKSLEGGLNEWEPGKEVRLVH